MHLRIKKGMIVGIIVDRKIVPALVVSDVFTVTAMQFSMVEVISQSKKRRIRTTKVKEIYV